MASTQSPPSPRTVKGKKARSYRLKDLLEDLETGDFSVYQAAWLLQPFGWNGKTVTIRDKPAYLLREALKYGKTQAFTVLVESCTVAAQEMLRVLLQIAAAPTLGLHLLHLLLDHGASAEFTDSRGRTALHIASKDDVTSRP